jgi:hypothetical protein
MTGRMALNYYDSSSTYQTSPQINFTITYVDVYLYWSSTARGTISVTNGTGGGEATVPNGSSMGGIPPTCYSPSYNRVTGNIAGALSTSLPPKLVSDPLGLVVVGTGGQTACSTSGYLGGPLIGLSDGGSACGGIGAVSAFGAAYQERSGPGLSVSGTNSAYGTCSSPLSSVSVSGTGPAWSCPDNGASVSSINDANGGAAAVSGTGNASGGFVNISGTGNAIGCPPNCSYDPASVSGTGNANGCYAAVSITGSASSNCPGGRAIHPLSP